MVELIKFLVTNIVDHPDEVIIEETIDSENTSIINISVHQEDMGKVIGKRGKIISAIREMAKVKAIKLGKKVKVILQDQKDQTSPLAPSASPE